MGLESMPDLTVVAIPLYIVTMAAEILLHWRRPVAGQVGYSAKDTATSLAMGVGSLVVAALLAVVQLGFLSFFQRFAVADLGGLLTAPDLAVAVTAWAALFVLTDLCYYAFHRVHHEVRLFWASHVPHHSSQHYNLSTALRQSWTPLTGWVFYVPLMILGFTPAQWAFAYSLNLIYQYWIHTERIDRMPKWFEYVWNTPSHHRVHHGSNPQYLDCNYGGILIIWDRVFGSFVPEREPVTYGLTTNIDSFNPARVAFHEFGAVARDVWRAPGWRARWRYAFASPGWSGSGAASTSGEAAVTGAAESSAKAS